MALTSASTLTNALAQLNNSLRWPYQASVAMAQDFAEAARWLLGNRPNTSTEEGSSVNFKDLEKQLEKAEEFIGARDLTRRQRFVAGRPT